MLWRLDGHRAHHPAAWQTLEHHIRPSDALTKAKHDVVVIDSLTGWVANLLLEHEASGAAAARDAVTRETDHFLETLEHSQHTVIMATNEVGAGVLPSNHLGMWTREALGQTNQRIATLCDTVALVIVGLPQALKGTLPKVEPLP
jgi:adenosyl cobinamide kinase/adenosyl cobinamide phosphate guanylyltransferase